MLKVVEAFSGIGAQAKALKNIKAQFEIVNTIEWDINAILAYDAIHNGEQSSSYIDELSKEEVLQKLSKFTLSINGKEPATKLSLSNLGEETLKKLYKAIIRTKNLVSITDVKADDLSNEIDLLTYSFPCQDLSRGATWHGNDSGLKRDAHNRSGMLWEVERILKEFVSEKKPLPTFLLMENVSNILSETHRSNFEEWQSYLEEIGYFNKIYTLDASNFGIPQKRVRTYMLSVFCPNEKKRKKVERYFRDNDLEITSVNYPKIKKPLSSFLRTDYQNKQYKKEADDSNQNDTPSRRKIYEDNDVIFDKKVKIEDIKTITTKQDRNPNSGIIIYKGKEGKAPYRTLTPRECFMLMGFDESDFQHLIDTNFICRGKDFYSYGKLIKMAGNSIVVNVLEEIFKQVIYLNDKVI